MKLAGSQIKKFKTVGNRTIQMYYRALKMRKSILWGAAKCRVPRRIFVFYSFPFNPFAMLQFVTFSVPPDTDNANELPGF